jgi:hypothetical protein
MFTIFLTNATYELLVFQRLRGYATLSLFKSAFHYLYNIIRPYEAILRYILYLSFFTVSILYWGTN